LSKVLEATTGNLSYITKLFEKIAPEEQDTEAAQPAEGKAVTLRVPPRANVKSMAG
jgi:hypothetical protein